MVTWARNLSHRLCWQAAAVYRVGSWMNATQLRCVRDAINVFAGCFGDAVLVARMREMVRALSWRSGWYPCGLGK